VFQANLWDPMCWRLVTKLLNCGCFVGSHHLTVNWINRQLVRTLNVLLHSSKRLNTLTMKYFRRRVWETRHSGATGWELPSLYSDVWCSSPLQLTRNSNWQLASSFRCQMWPHWMYVSKSIIKQENKSQLTRIYVILRVQEIKFRQR